MGGKPGLLSRRRVLLLLANALTACANAVKLPAADASGAPPSAANTDAGIDAAEPPEQDAAPDSALDSGEPAPRTPSPIIAENLRPGVAHDEPDKQADTQVAGYCSAVSAAPGETVQLMVNVDRDQHVRWDLYRVGYYGGLGMRLVAASEPKLVTVQPAHTIDSHSGMIECDWAAAFDVTIEQDWVSGYYVFELINEDGFGSRVPLIVKEGKRRAEALAQASVTTWQAYNKWGGVCLYSNNKHYPTFKRNRASTVSFDRPYQSQNEHPPFLCLVRFLERHGYDVSYTTNIDVDADASLLAGRKMFMTLAHDEYWTVAQRDAMDAARDQGVSLGFFSANTGYWRIRLESSERGVPRRRMTTYKNAGLDPIRNAPETTDMFQKEPFARPENALLGIAYKTWSKVPGYPYIVTKPDHWVYEGTGVKYYEALNNVVGAEWDGVLDNGMTPQGLEVLARAVTIDNDGAFIEGEANITVYYPTSQSIVFAAGSIYWGYGLAGGPFADDRVERMTENVLARGGLASNLPFTEPRRAAAPRARFKASVLAGNGVVAQTDGPALDASFVAPTGMAAGPDGRLYIVDRGDHVLRVLSPDGKLSSMVSRDETVFARPMGLAIDRHGTLYLSDSKRQRIFKITSDGTVTPFAGAATEGADNASDPLQATFSGPHGLAVGPNDEVYVADTLNNAIRRIDASGVTTVASDLRYVSGVAVASDGAVYFSTIIKGQIGVVRNGEVTILANVAGNAGNREGPAAEARLQPGEGMIIEDDRLLFVDTENNRVRALSLTKPALITTVYGDGNATPDPRDAGRTWLPRALVRWNGGYAVSDFGSRRILWFKPA